ncbi:MAG: AAA family ATPase [Caulobacteraceae bacterium]|nr:AAA family ATPase [Caulobacteraceae bacterium]
MSQENFSEIVGQDKIKNKLNFLIEGYKKTKILPHLLFVAPRGCGKTLIAQKTANLLGREKTIMVNCSTIKNVKSFFNQIMLPYVFDKDTTIIFDEASELPRDVTMALLTILNPNSTNQNDFTFDEGTYTFRFNQNTFIFCTTEAQKIFHALLDRLYRIDLQDYSHGELGKIINGNLSMKNQSVKEDILNEVASVCRGNARQAQSMANQVSSYLASKNSKELDKTGWLEIKDRLSIYPLGLTEIELNVIKLLKEYGELRLTNLSAKTNLTKDMLQKNVELYLMRNHLIEIRPTGRALTKKGHDYHKEHLEKR